MLDDLIALGEESAIARPRPLPAAPEAVIPSPLLSGAAESDPAPLASAAPGQASLFTEAEVPIESRSLAERFGGVPPFSVLDGRAGYWQRRKAEWLALGIQSELGRGDGILWGSAELQSGDPRQVRDHSYYQKLRRQQEAAGVAAELEAARPRSSRKGATATSTKLLERHWPARLRREQDLTAGNLTGAGPLPEWATNGYAHVAPGTSIFDPVLCELAYRWFSPGPGSSILDPFAGGSVRGIVASILGRDYTGVDLQERQVEANRAQGEALVPERPPRWIVGDSRELGELLPAEERFDLVFSCPPYYDLEVYSEDPLDLSTAPTYAAFLEGYEAIIEASLARLREDRFAVFVVGELRDKRGLQLGFVADTIRLFRDHGAALYNEAVFLQPPGTLPLRVRRQMDVARKLGRAHQAFLVFWKGAKGPKWEPVMGTEDPA